MEWCDSHQLQRVLTISRELFILIFVKKHFSAGGILVNDKGGLFLTYKKARSEWSLPKGGIKKGESRLEAALREVKEETGYQNIEPIKEAPTHTVTWIFTHEDTGKQEQKTVYYFLFRLLRDKRVKTPQMEEEGFSGNWFTFEQAQQKVSFENIKEVLEKAKKVLIY